MVTVDYSLNSLCNKWHDVVYCINFSYSFGNDFQMILILVLLFIPKRSMALVLALVSLLEIVLVWRWHRSTILT